MLLINLAILKLFIDRNSFTIKERRNLNFTVNAGFDLVDDNEEKLQIISQHNEQGETDSLSMTTGIIPEKSPDNETILIPTPINTHVTSPTNVSGTQHEKVHFQAPVTAQENEWKGKMSTRIIDDIILRIYFPITEEGISTVNPEIFAASIPETSTTMNQSALNFNTQGTTLLF